MRITLLSTHTSPLVQPGVGDGGGLNVYVREVSTRLARRGHDLQVLTRRDHPDQPDVHEWAEGVQVRHVDAGPAAPVPKEGLPSLLCGFTMQARPLVADRDILHSHYWLSGWVARRLARRADIPFVHTFHTIGVMKNETLAPGDQPESALRLEAERRIAADAGRILALTRGEARLLHRHFGLAERRITTVPAGVDVDLFSPEPRPEDAAVLAGAFGDAGRAASGGLDATPPGTSRRDVPDGALQDLPEDVPLVVFVGRLQRLKGPDVAVAMLGELRRVVPDAHLAVVGGASGSELGAIAPDQLLQQAEHLGVRDAVTLLPAMPQARLAALYRRADVVVVPSRSETFGLVALEAQATATPVVAADVGGLSYVVGDGGRLVDGYDAGDWARATAGLLTDDDLAAKVGAAGRAKALESSWDATVDRLERVYGAMVDHDLARGA